ALRDGHVASYHAATHARPRAIAHRRRQAAKTDTKRARRPTIEGPARLDGRRLGAMIIRKIPWIPTANWECSIDLSGEIYRLAVRWNGRASQWFFSLHRANGEHVALGVPMI